MLYARQLATEGGVTVAMHMISFGNFTARPESSYQAHLDDGYAIVHGTAVEVDTTGMTVLEPRANLREACDFFSSFDAERGVMYVLVCEDGHKVQMRLKSVEEELRVQQALERFHRNRETRTTEP